MPNNILVTGRPGTGKTTLIEEVAKDVRDGGYTVGGVFSPEIRVGGERKGFRIVDAWSGEGEEMAHVSFEGPSVGKYGVDVGAVDRVSREAFRRVIEADVVVVDEVAPMEVVSGRFREGVRGVLDSDIPVLAAIHYSSNIGFIGEVKDRSDVEVFEVTRETREELHTELLDMVMDAVT